MKRILTMSSLMLVMMLAGSVQNKVSAQPVGDVSYQTFYDELSPYGTWIDYPEYGYVWQPAQEADFRPYSTNGHWVWSDDYDWTWVSDYDWGWAPFHYGRWFSDPSYGWLWVPGYEWAPAWVAWRSGGDFYGWAPLRPGIDIGVDFSMGSYYAPDDYWCFAPARYILSPRIYDYCIDRRQNFTIIHNTFIINSFNRNRNVFITGPRRNEAEGFIGQRITPVRFRESSRPGRYQFNNNEISIYRPNIQRDDNRRFSPSRFDRYNRSVQNNDNRFTRNDNTRREFNNNDRTNNLPVRRDQNDNINRRNDNNNWNNQRSQTVPGRIDNSNRNNDDRTIRQNERPTPPVNNDNRTNDRRNFQDNNNRNSRNDNAPVRQMPDTRNDNRFQPQPRQEQPRQEQPRQEQPREQTMRQEQPRQFDRHDNGNSNNNSNNQGRRRF